jgi:hypothetical protein
MSTEYFQTDAFQKRITRQNEIMGELIAKGISPITAVVMSGDIQIAEMATEMVVNGTPATEALNFVGSYARFDWAVANLPKRTLLKMLPELWRSADPDDTKPEYLALWREAYKANGGTVCDGKQLPTRYGNGAAIERPAVLTIYRGQIGNTVGISWTLDRKIAAKFAATGGGRAPVSGGKILKRVIRRDEALAYLTGRGESEVIVDIAEYCPFYSSHGHGRKTHISDGDYSLCGVENRNPQLLFSQGVNYHNIEEQFFIDSEGVGCKQCGAEYRKRTGTN